MSSAGPGFVKRGGGHGYDARGELIGQNAAALNYVGKGLGELWGPFRSPRNTHKLLSHGITQMESI